MKLGLQTLGWGIHRAALDVVSDFALQLGCDGLEIGQPTEMLEEPALVSAMCRDKDLKIAGLTGGSLAAKINVAFSLKPEYLYLDEWEESTIPRALTKQVTLAIHPHFYKKINTIKAAQYYLERHPEIRLILDPVHQYLSGDNALHAFKSLHRKVIAIHLKDWQPNYGTSPQLFARGFTYLGNGILKHQIRELINCARQLKFDGWLILDHEALPGDPADGVRKSREWLRKVGL